MSPIYNPYKSSQVMPWFLLKEILSIFLLTSLTQTQTWSTEDRETSIVLASQARIVGPGEVEGDQYRGTHSYAGLLSPQC